jgi:hypothetical protein
VDEKEEKQSIFDYNFVIAFALVLIVLVVVIILVTSDQSQNSTVTPDTIQTQAIPLYPGIRRIILDTNERNTYSSTYLIAGVSQGDLPKIKTIDFEVYGLKSDEKLKALEYYNTEMVKQGWTVVPPLSPSITDIKTFTKNKKYAIVSVQSLDSKDVPAYIPDKYQAGEIGLVIIATDADLYRLKAGK